MARLAFCCGRSADSDGSTNRQSRKKSAIEVNAVLEGLGYSIGQKLGEGTFTEVRAASHRKQPYKLAVKIVDRQQTDESRATVPVTVFQPELEIIGKMKHPNIVQLFQVRHYIQVYKRKDKFLYSAVSRR